MGGLQSSVNNPDLEVKSWMGCNLQSSVQELELVKSRGAVVLHGSIVRLKDTQIRISMLKNGMKHACGSKAANLFSQLMS